MKKINIILLLIIAIFISQYIYAQDDDNPESKLPPKKLFYIDPLVFYGTDSVKGRLDLYIEVPLTNLNFKRNQAANTFDALLDYNVTISNASKEVYANFHYVDTIRNTSEEQKSVNEMSNFMIKQYYLNPGSYTL